MGDLLGMLEIEIGGQGVMGRMHHTRETFTVTNAAPNGTFIKIPTIQMVDLHKTAGVACSCDEINEGGTGDVGIKSKAA